MNFFLTIGYILFFQFIGVSQVYQVLYGEKQKFNKNIPDFIKNNAEQRKAYLKSKERIRVYRLEHINGQSVYTEHYSMLDGMKDDNMNYFSLSHPIVYKDFTEGCFIQTGKLVGKDQAVREYFDEFFEWTVVQESDSLIAGFHCKKATTHYRDNIVIAWFTESIPIMDGPGFFAGLPGLILQLQSSWDVTEVMDIQILEKATESIKLPDVKKYVTFKQFLKDRFKYLD